MSRRSKLLLLALALLGVSVLSGCVAFVSGNPTASQPGVIGSVEISSLVCASDVDASAHQGCTNGDVAGGDADGNSNFEAPTDPATFQMLAAYRVPDGSNGPGSFASDSQPGPVRMIFNRSPSYENEMQRVAPAPAGQKWVGYLSQPFAYDANASSSAANNRVSFSPSFTLPPGAGGSPFAGPFNYQQVVGARSVTDALSSGRPVVCGPANEPQNVQDETTCRDAPPAGSIQNNISVSTRELTVNGGGSVAAPQGATTTVPFSARFAGTATEAANFSLSASTTVPGGDVDPSQAAFAPASDSTTGLSARLRVPSGTPAGTYNVTLTATLAGGETRSATRQVTVAADRSKPRATASIVKGQSVRSLLKKGLKVRVKMNEPGRVTSELLGSSGFLAKNKVLGKKTTRFTRAQTKTVRIKLGKKARRKKARRKMLAKKRIKLVVRNKARDSSGNRRTTNKKVTLKRGK